MRRRPGSWLLGPPRCVQRGPLRRLASGRRQRHLRDRLLPPRGLALHGTGGTGPYLAAAALAGALRALVDIGPAAIAARVEALVARLVDGLTGLRVELVSALEPEHRSGIVVFRSSAEVEDERRLVERLEQAGVAVSLRFSTGTGGIRVSPYLYNDESDVDRLLTALES